MFNSFKMKGVLMTSKNNCCTVQEQDSNNNKTDNFISATARINRLRDRYFEHVPSICIERVHEVFWSTSDSYT